MEHYQFDSKTNAKIFRDFYSNLASDLLKTPQINLGKKQLKNITRT